MSLNKHLLSFAVAIFVILCLKLKTGDAVTGPKHGKIVVCYLAAWSVYRPSRGSFEIENVDPTLCTHIVYSFAGLSLTHDGIISLDPWQDLTDDYGKGGYKRVVGLKQSFPHLKITLAIGGWTQGSANYSSMVKDPTKRGKFVANAIEFLKKYNFDGLDLDWEFPGKRGGAPEDKLNFLLLVKELRSAFTKFKFLLTSAFGTGKDTIDTAYDVQGLSYYLDFIHLMCYDYHGSWDQKTGPNSPLRSSDVLSVEYTVNYLIKMGASPTKLILGVPLYGRTFLLENEALQNSKIFKLGALAKSTGFQGVYTREDGFMGYNEICVQLQNVTAGYKTYWDDVSETPFAVSGGKLISYDNEKSILEKIRFSMKQKLGGVMVWSMDTDDFRGDCGTENYPLLRSINRNIETTLEDIKRDAENEINHGIQDKNKKDDSGGSNKITAGVTVACAYLAMLISKLYLNDFS